MFDASSATSFTFTSLTARHYILDTGNNTTTQRMGTWTANVTIPPASSFAAGTVVNITACGNNNSPTFNVTSSGSTFSGFVHANASTFTQGSSVISFVSNGVNRWFRIN
jgi:hypothetical protein